MNKLAVVLYLAAVPEVVFGAAVTAEGGTASFMVTTTVPGISVKGKSTALEARAEVQHNPEGLRLEKVEASLPVKSILTGMALRDEHMRSYIFTTDDGKIPDLRFEAGGTACAPQPGRTAEFSCQVSGALTMRGVTRPFSIPLKIRVENQAFRATGASTVKLSDYGIGQPSQFGVKTADEVQLHIEFTGKEAPDTITSGGRR
jgi:polyisoprenoid-binding protein YceI